MLFGIREEINYEIEKLVTNFNLSYIDAILCYCEKNGFDEEYIGSIIMKNQALMEKIALEAEGLNFLEKQDRLPI
jgi:hypothetical protein